MKSSPEVVIVYTPSDGNAHIIGATRTTGNKWLYSKPTIIPAGELAGFIKAYFGRTHYVFDVRHKANQQRAGMGSATPVLIAKHGVDLQVAVGAAEQLHTAILALPDD